VSRRAHAPPRPLLQTRTGLSCTGCSGAEGPQGTSLARDCAWFLVAAPSGVVKCSGVNLTSTLAARPGPEGQDERRRVGPLAARIAVTVIAALVVALLLKRVPVGWAPLLLLAAPAAVVALVFARSAGPRWVAAVFIAATFLGVYRATASVGRINLRPTDIAFVALVAWVLVLRPLGKVGTDIGQRQIGLLLGVMGLSLVPVLIVHPSQFFSPLVSWLRMVQTFSLALLIPYFVRDRPQRSCGPLATRPCITGSPVA
jgi:hypothetical protein